MKTFTEYLARNPKAAAMLYGALLGYAGYCAFTAGRAFSRLGSALDMAASQELGG